MTHCPFVTPYVIFYPQCLFFEGYVISIDDCRRLCHHSGTMVHHISNFDPATNTADCSVCGRVGVYVRKRGNAKDLICRTKMKEWKKRWKKTEGGRRSTKRCNAKIRDKMRALFGKNFQYRKHMKPTCQKCGFVPVDKCQLDIHHLDRNRKNNLPGNLITLCANCHRLEHKDG